MARFLRTARGITGGAPTGGGVPTAAARIDGANTSDAAFIGIASPGAPAAAVDVTSLVAYERTFGSADGELRRAVRLFFDNGGTQLSDGLQVLDDIRFSI